MIEPKQIIDTIKGLSLRERVIVAAGAIFVIGLLFYFIVLSPTQERSKLLRRLITQKEQDYRQLCILRDDYLRLKASEDDIVTRIAAARNVSPLSYLEQLAQKAGLREQLELMKPLPSISTPRYTITPVQVSVRGAGVHEVLTYLYQIENAPVPFHIKRLRIKPTPRTSGRLDATLEIMTFSG
jgi:Tfp pilus assembly protein PilO